MPAAAGNLAQVLQVTLGAKMPRTGCAPGSAIYWENNNLGISSRVS